MHGSAFKASVRSITTYTRVRFCGRPKRQVLSLRMRHVYPGTKSSALVKWSRQPSFRTPGTFSRTAIRGRRQEIVRMLSTNVLHEGDRHPSRLPLPEKGLHTNPAT